MMVNDNSTAKWIDKNMEGEEGLRTVECLRGRLLAERAASKAANDESDQISKKVTELEKQLQMEIKSRNKAEKRLKFLMKKLSSLNISYVSTDESSSFSEKSEISSVSSSSRSQDQMELHKTQFNNLSEFVTDAGERRNYPPCEDNLGSLDEAISGNSNSNVMQSNQKDGDENALKKDENKGSKCPVTKNIDNEEHDQDTYCNVDESMALVIVEEKTILTTEHVEDRDASFDNSMALVIVDSMITEEKQDIPISNGNVKDVLDALRYARESIQASMEMRRHMGSSITEARVNGISFDGIVIVEEKTILTTEHVEDRDASFDNSMALVIVDSVITEEKQDIPISNGNVKDVLDALRYARESIQASMEMRRHMGSSITEARVNGISC
ncbi:hypothetical protein LXL04_012642 [Taraxacum kok-saghyz]